MTHSAPAPNTKKLIGLMVGALGVVYGDIGTSPLYALHETFFGHHPLEKNPENVLGVLSFFFWSLFLVVGVKYIYYVMRADNRGEGGIFALLTLINQGRSRIGPKKLKAGFMLILLGAALLLADGMITPAISVLSAVSGLQVLAPRLEDYVVPITLVILIGLFMVQPFGTNVIGRVFGPVMAVWFVMLALLGLPHILAHPEVLKSINPMHALHFTREHGLHTLWVLGSVVLCITGGEALYADMGHFGRKPITRSWWCLVYPGLLLNYFGQGGMLLNPGPVPGDNLFYSLVPIWALLPMIALSTAATIIASQALISGSFSLIQQAIALGVFPRQRVIHTNPEVEGQIYLPFVNWSLMLGCLGLVVGFRSASALAAAYGIAVTGTMAITTIAFYMVARYIWNWKRELVIPLCGAFLLIDLIFLGANMLKFFDGGFVPVIMAIVLFVIMHCWHWGRGFIAKCYQQLQYATLGDLLRRKKDPDTLLLDRSIVVLASRPVSASTDTIPPALHSRLDHLGAIYKHIAILSVVQHPGVKDIEEASRLLVTVLQDDPVRGSIVTVQVFYGYMQDPDIAVLLERLLTQGIIRAGSELDTAPFSILSGAERLISNDLNWWNALRLSIFRVLLRNANTVLKYFNLEFYPDVSTEVVNLGVIPARATSWLIDTPAVR